MKLVPEDIHDFLALFLLLDQGEVPGAEVVHGGHDAGEGGALARGVVVDVDAHHHDLTERHGASPKLK